MDITIKILFIFITTGFGFLIGRNFGPWGMVGFLACGLLVGLFLCAVYSRASAPSKIPPCV